jgi:hypothetical protein
VQAFSDNKINGQKDNKLKGWWQKQCEKYGFCSSMNSKKDAKCCIPNLLSP